MSKMQSSIAAAFDTLPDAQREPLLWVRGLILDLGQRDPRLGGIEETLKWGQPAYVTKKRKTGSTIRLGVEKSSGLPALFFICNTTLVEGFRTRFGPRLRYSKNRAVLIDGTGQEFQSMLEICILSALTYHLGD